MSNIIDEKNPKINVGLRFTEALTIVFIILKLCGVINWSWFFVILPLFAGLIIYFLIILIGLIIIAVLKLLEKISNIFN